MKKKIEISQVKNEDLYSQDKKKTEKSQDKKVDWKQSRQKKRFNSQDKMKIENGEKLLISCLQTLVVLKILYSYWGKSVFLLWWCCYLHILTELLILVGVGFFPNIIPEAQR